MKHWKPSRKHEPKTQQMGKEQWIWEVSVWGQDWEETVCTDEYDRLQSYFDDMECQGEVDIKPVFRKLLVTDFKWLCVHHGNILKDNGSLLVCEQCAKDSPDGQYEIEPSYKLTKPSTSN